MATLIDGDKLLIPLEFANPIYSFFIVRDITGFNNEMEKKEFGIQIH